MLSGVIILQNKSSKFNECFWSFSDEMYSHAQKLKHKFVSAFTNKLVKWLYEWSHRDRKNVQ